MRSLFSLALVGLLAMGCQAQQPSQSQAGTASPAASAPSPEAEVAARGGFQPQASEGLKVSRWADVPNARSLAVSPDGKYVFVGTRANEVYRITVGDTPKVEVFQEMDGPNGVCFTDQGELLVAQRTKVWKFSPGAEPGSQGQLVLDGLPDESHHGWRYIKQGPDGRVYIGIGAPCNVCERDDPRFASLSSFQLDGNDFRVDAHGVRNTVGFVWQPGSGDLYFTDNGRDWLGDTKPPCELNILKKGETDVHYGFPYVWGDNQPDADFIDKAPKGVEFRPPVTGFKAHVAPLGCHFPLHQKWSERRNQVLVAQHGSWNRSTKVGYRVVSVDLEQGNSVEPFLWGFLESSGKVHGRPVDVDELPDGSLLVSDDSGGVVWKISPP